MKDMYRKIILKYVEILVPNERKPRYSPGYYLTNILNLLNDFNSWRSLTKSIDIDREKPNHYKTIAAIHRLWSERGVYRKAFEEIRNICNSAEDLAEIDILIDATLIINKYGSDYVGYGGETRKKKFTKITMITDTKKKIINLAANKTSEKEIVFGIVPVKRKRGRPKKCDTEVQVVNDDVTEVAVNSKPTEKQTACDAKCDINTKINNQDLDVIHDPKLVKKIKINTLEHDVKGIDSVFENCGLSKDRKKNLIGDGGYIMNDADKKRLLDRNINMITPYRKNQKKINTATEKTKLKGRSAIERSFASVKHNNNRIHVRKDRLLVNYLGFFYLGVIKAS